MRKYTALFLVIVSFAFALPAIAETVAPTSEPTISAFANSTPEELLQQWHEIGELLRANGNYPFTELAKGDKGHEVVALQTRLAELGFYKKEVVDNFGNGTFSAFKAFEKANDLKVNGVASVEDQKVLFGSEAVANTDGKVASSSIKSSNDSDATSGATSN